MPKEHTGNSTIAMYMAASMLGLGNACTPLGIKAMQDLQIAEQDQEHRNRCAVHGHGYIHRFYLRLIPSTVIAMRTTVDPTGAAEIVGPTILTTLCAALVCIISTKLLGRPKCFRYDYLIEKDRAAGRLRINENYIGDDPLCHRGKRRRRHVGSIKLYFQLMQYHW